MMRRLSLKQRVLIIAVLLGCLMAICAVTIFARNVSIEPAGRITPEYLRTLGQVVVSLRAEDSSLELMDRVIDGLPAYSKVYVLAPSVNIQEIGKSLNERKYKSNIQLIPYPTSMNPESTLYMSFPEESKLIEVGPLYNEYLPKGTLWAQDLFEVTALEGGGVAMLVPEVYKWFEKSSSPSGGAVEDAVLSDNRFLSKVSLPGVSVRRVPFTFMGGNVLVDVLRGRRIAFVGHDVIQQSISVRRGTQDNPYTPEQLRRLIRRSLGVDEVVVVGRDKQPFRMFHLDQAMVPLGGGMMGVSRVMVPGAQSGSYSGNEELEGVREFLSSLRAQLSSMGYRVIDLNITDKNVLAYQYYANGIPYTDMLTGQRMFLMPRFAVNNEYLDLNVRSLEAVGYGVRIVDTAADNRNGGIHCMVNALR